MKEELKKIEEEEQKLRNELQKFEQAKQRILVRLAEIQGVKKYLNSSDSSKNKK